MDFDSVKAPTINYVSQSVNKPQAQENVKNSQKNSTEVNEKENKEVKRAKEIYESILSDKKKTSEDDGDEKKKKSYTEKEIDTMINAANVKLSPIHKSFEYDYHNVTKRLMIKVVDTDTKNLIKEIPPEKVQDALANMWELAGLIVDEKR